MQPAVASGDHCTSAFDLRARSQRGVVEHLKECATVNAEATLRMNPPRVIADIQDDVLVWCVAAVEPVDRRAERAERIAAAHFIEHGHADGLLVKAGSGALTHGIPTSAGVPESYASETLVADYNDIESVERFFEANPGGIAAIIVEPVAGNMGVVLPREGFLAALRKISQDNGALLIFDEVITGFGRLGHAFAAERYGVVPDMITFAKGITAGSVPMGGVIARKGIYDAFMKGPEHVIELFHGYTYSAHPLAVAAGLATLDLYKQEDLFNRAKKLEPFWYDTAMSLKGTPGVLDIRCVGLTCGIDLAPRKDTPGKRGYESLEYAFHDLGMMLRAAGDTLCVSPPLIVSEAQIGEIFDKLGKVIKAIQ